MIDLFASRKVETIRQHEASECGLAAMAMLARFHGHRIDLPYLRSIRDVSKRGLTFADLIDLANRLALDARGFMLDSPDDLMKLSLPAILHWAGNHFVVLEHAGPRGYVIHDPASGKRTCTRAELVAQFSGAALEVEPRMDFAKIHAERKSSLLGVLAASRGLKSAAVQIGLVSITVELLSLALPVLMQLALDVVLPQFDLSLLTVMAIALGLFLLFDACGRWLREMIVLSASTQFQLQFTRNVVGHLFRLPMRFFETRHPGDIVARLDSIDAIKTTLAGGLVVTVTDFVMSILTVALMLSYSVPMTLAVMASLAVLVLLRFAFFPAMQGAMRSSLEAHAEERSRLMDGLRQAEALKVHDVAEPATARWYESFVQFANTDYRARRITRHADLVLQAIVAASSALIFYWGVAAVMDNTISIGMLTAFMALKGTFYHQVDSITQQLLNLGILKVHFDRVDDLAAETPETPPGTPAIARTIRDRVSLEDAAIQFSADEPPIVAGINLALDVAGGESIAIVGPSGSGKSSLVKLIAGLHPLHHGRLLVDDLPLARYGLAAYRAQLGVVFADDGLFAGTVAENLAMFRPDVPRATMEQALAAVGLIDEITRLPQGLATRLSSAQSLLSTGQRRRLLAARAICRAPRLMLFDEITANLDPAAEAALVAGLTRQSAAKVFVTHSAALLGRVDRVFAIEDGRLMARDANPARAVVLPGPGSAPAAPSVPDVVAL